MNENTKPTREVLISRIPLKESTLNITSQRLIRSKKNSIVEKLQDGYGINLNSVDMAFPLKKDQISIHYTGAGARKENTRFIIKHTLKEKNAIQTCEQITAAIQKKRNSIHNEHGWLILQPGEIILSAEKATSRKGSGIFYVTTKGLYFEHEKNGLGFKLPYSMFNECHIKGSRIIIKYTEIHSNREEEFYEYEILLSVKERIKKTVQKIRNQYKESHAQDQHEFDILEKKFVNFKGMQLRKILMQKSIDQKTGDAMEDMLPLIPNWFDLMATRVTEASYELQKYIGYIADDMFGDTGPKIQWCLCSNWFVRNTIFGDSGQCFDKFHPNGINREQIRTNPEKVMTDIDQIIQAHGDFHFRMLEMRLIKTALLLDVPLDKIGKHTDQYKEMMAEYEKDFEHHRKCEIEHHKWKIKYESIKADIEAKSKTKEEYEGMIKKEEFVNCVRQYKKYTDERAKYTSKPQTAPPSKKQNEMYTEDINNGGFEFDWNTEYWEKKYQQMAVTEYITLLFRIYDHWKKDIKLTGYSDPNNKRWTEHILKSMPWPNDEMIMFRNEKNYLQEEIQRTTALKQTLKGLRIPEDVPDENKYSADCWLNKEKDIIFSRASVAKQAAKVAKITGDTALQKYGFSAYGFSVKDVDISEKFGYLPTIMVPVPMFAADKREPVMTRIVLSAVPSEKITPEMVICMNSGRHHLETEPYEHSIAMRAGRMISEETKKSITDSFNRYADTNIINHDGEEKSYPPSTVFTSAMILETAEMAFAIRNSGIVFSGPEAALEIFESYANTKKSMPFEIDTRVLPLYERIRRMHFVMITGEPLVSRPGDYVNAEEEYKSLKKVIQTELNPLPTVEEGWKVEMEKILALPEKKE